MKASEVLRAARKLIERPEQLCRHAYSIDAEGNALPYERRREAVAFCSAGAIIAVAEVDSREAALVHIRSVMHDNIPAWSDSHTHPEVLAAFDRAIALAEAEETPAIGPG